MNKELKEKPRFHMTNGTDIFLPIGLLKLINAQVTSDFFNVSCFNHLHYERTSILWLKCEFVCQIHLEIAQAVPCFIQKGN